MLPPDPRVTEDPDQVLDLLDGLILAGGADIDPSTYGAERHPATDHGSIERDEFELAHWRGARWSATYPSSASAAACR